MPHLHILQNIDTILISQAVVQFMIDYVAKRDATIKETKPKGRWSIFCSCLRKHKWAERNAQYVRDGS
jgi:hypothetical protein